jgi:hypothetical protein
MTLKRVPLAEAETTQYGFTRVIVPAGTEVVLPPGQYGRWVATITADGLACDCGKGVLCPLNPRAPMTLHCEKAMQHLERALEEVNLSLAGNELYEHVAEDAAAGIRRAMDAIEDAETP